MDEIFNADRRDTEIAALNHEIYELSKQIADRDRQILELNTTDRNDPFGNPTDYKEYSGDYTKILPELGVTGYKMPLDPEYAERKALRKSYSIGGWCAIIHFVLSFGLAYVLVAAVSIIVRLLNPDASGESLKSYLMSSSILMDINTIVYMLCNISIGFLGMKWAGIKKRSLIRTKDLSVGRIVQYCLIGVFIWIVSIYCSNAVIDICSKYGIDLLTHNNERAKTLMGKMITVIYGCIIAPITEEIFYRGMFLKTMAKADQRFAIFVTAFMFGIAHGNVAQFVLGFLAGIFLAHITMKHGSIVPAIIVHMFINTVSTLFGAVDSKDRSLLFISTMMLFAAAVVGLVMLLLFRSADDLPTPTPHQRRRGFIVAISSAPLTISLLMNIGYTIKKIVENSR